MAKNNLVQVGGELVSVAGDGIVTDASAIKDYTTGRNKTQKEINDDMYEAIGSGGSVDEKIQAEATRAQGAEEALDDRVDTLEDVVEDCAYIGENDGTAVIADFDPQTDTVWKKAQTLSNAEKAQVKTNLGLPNEVYSKTEVNELVSTPHQNYVTVSTYAELPASGSTDTIYRVSNYDGTQVAAGVYSEYAWSGSAYVFLAAKSSVGEVFDISEYHAGTKYANLAAALDSNNGGGVPQSLQKGGMSVKYVSNSDNKYVQYRLMSDTFNTTVDNWQKQGAEVVVSQNTETGHIDINVGSSTTSVASVKDVNVLKFDITWEQGGIVSNTGEEEPRTDRTRTNFIPIYIISTLKILSGYDFLAFYDANKGFLGIEAYYGGTTKTSNELKAVYTGGEYVRLVTTNDRTHEQVYDIEQSDYAFITNKRLANVEEISSNNKTKLDILQDGTIFYDVFGVDEIILSRTNGDFATGNVLLFKEHPSNISAYGIGLFRSDDTRIGNALQFTSTTDTIEVTITAEMSYIKMQWGNSNGQKLHVLNESVINVYNQEERITALEEEESGNKLKGKNIAILGDSIMQLMRSNDYAQDFWFEDSNGNKYEYDSGTSTFPDVTNINGIPYVTSTLVDGQPTVNSVKLHVVNSNTAQNGYDSQDWIGLKNYTQAKNLYNLGVGGSTFSESGSRFIITDVPTPGDSLYYYFKSIGNQVRHLLKMVNSGSWETPDLIVVWAGTNETNVLAEPSGEWSSFEYIMKRTYANLSDDVNGYSSRQTLYGGLRYVAETLCRTFPYATVMFGTPVQTGYGNLRSDDSLVPRGYSQLEVVGDCIRKICKRYSIQVFDALTEIGLANYAEVVNNGSDRASAEAVGNQVDTFLRGDGDYLHPNDEGKVLWTNYLFSRINAMYFPKK